MPWWQKIHVPHDKRKYPSPQVHESIHVCIAPYFSTGYGGGATLLIGADVGQ